MEELISRRGNYKRLLSYQKADVIYCLTYYFVERYIRYNDRTKDQMLQAARSGKQNIIEGCAASVTSAKTEIRLVNVAKASLQELLEDYEDYLKTRGHRQWEERSVEWEAMRNLGRVHNDAAFFYESCSNSPARNHRQHVHCAHQASRFFTVQAAQALGEGLSRSWRFQ